jgi:environmental stress-induced protein Ves
MTQWLRKKIISFMGRVYLWLDKGVVHETSPILDIPIDQDFQDMSRQELCQHIENKFDWKNNSFWNLESTQKIRLCCQVARNIMGEEE